MAVYGGGRVNRYSPEGALIDVIPVPAEQCTCCAFGGPGMQRLYVTTASENWSDSQRRAKPEAGLVYRLDTDATGRPAALFRPAPAWWNAVREGSGSAGCEEMTTMVRFAPKRSLAPAELLDVVDGVEEGIGRTGDTDGDLPRPAGVHPDDEIAEFWLG